MFENRVNNKDCRNRCTRSVHGVEFDTETSRIKINNFQPGKRYILNGHCYANMFSNLN